MEITMPIIYGKNILKNKYEWLYEYYNRKYNEITDEIYC